MSIWLLDTGPVVAYLDPHDPSHAQAVAVIDPFRGQFLTTGAVIGEVMHFSRGYVGGAKAVVDFVLESRMEIFDCFKYAPIARAARLMQKYRDIPMDFADATLVVLAEEVRVDKICTLDRRGFSAFRTVSGRRFQLVLDSANA